MSPNYFAYILMPDVKNKAIYKINILNQVPITNNNLTLPILNHLGKPLRPMTLILPLPDAKLSLVLPTYIYILPPPYTRLPPD